MKGDRYFICNIISDEKFIDGAIECFDLYADKWDMQWIICQNINQELKYIKRHSERVFNISENVVLQYLAENKFDAVILHSFGVVSPIIIKQIPKEIKVFWFGWGYDIYNYPEHKPFLKWNLYKPITNKYIKTSTYKNIRHFASKIKFFLMQKDNLYNKAFNRIDFFSGVVDFEYDLLKQNPKFRAHKVRFSYSSLDLINSYKNYEKYNGNNILVGNSAAITNNHLDLLQYLKQIDLNNRKIIIPLSYAGPKKYVEDVVNLYKRTFNNNVITLTDFMPFVEYKQYIQSCSSAIFFMNRQQAMGNIITALKLGCKVFLSENNPIYEYYKDLGMNIFSVEQDLSNENFNICLTDKEIENNRNILKNINDYDATLNKLETIYQAIYS